MNNLFGQFRNFDVFGHLFPGIVFIFCSTLFVLHKNNIPLNRIPLNLEQQMLLKDQAFIVGILLLVFAYIAGYILSTLSMYFFWCFFKGRTDRRIIMWPQLENKREDLSYIQCKDIDFLEKKPTVEQLKEYAKNSWQMAQALAALNSEGLETLPFAGRARMMGSIGLMFLLFLIVELFNNWFKFWGDSSFSFGVYIVCGVLCLVCHILAGREWVYYREYLSVKLILFNYKIGNSELPQAIESPSSSN
ncbi:MAG: hypothetical protein AAFQ80_11165 [Cyanobacteria bacterium J06621_8]